MKMNWIDTQKIYRDIINAGDDREREERYIADILDPWREMMEMVSGILGGNASDDPFTGARTWNWLVPEQLKEARRS